MLHVELQVNVQNNISPSLCLQTWKVSSVANRVLGCRMKIFVLEGKSQPGRSSCSRWTLHRKSVASIQSHMPTCPSCTHPVCSPDVWWGTARLLLPYLSSWARCQDTEPYTWAQKRTLESHTALYLIRITATTIKQVLCKKKEKL